MALLTTHVLDLMNGRPAKGLRLSLNRGEEVLAEATTNADGRCEGPLGTDLVSGEYEIRFEVGAYLTSLGVESPFLDVVPVRFHLENGQKYHVPLTFTPWAYSTYRGS